MNRECFRGRPIHPKSITIRIISLGVHCGIAKAPSN
jgi:hypothetical protein